VRSEERSGDRSSASSIFALIRRATLDKVETELALHGGHLVHSSLSRGAEERLRAVLGAGTRHLEQTDRARDVIALPPIA